MANGAAFVRLLLHQPAELHPVLGTRGESGRDCERIPDGQVVAGSPPSREWRRDGDV